MSRRFRHPLLRALAAAAALIAAGVALPEAVTAQPRVRIAGSDRYETAVEISRQLPLASPQVLIASGEQFPDAITAGWVSGAFGFPVLLVRRDSVPPVTRAELTRLAPARATVLGGTAAVSDAVVAEIESLGIAVDRVAGADRYATAARIAFYGVLGGAASPRATLLVANGTDFADAMVAGAAGAVYGLPMLLVRGDGPLLDAMAGALDDFWALGFRNVIIVGSPAEVSDGVAAQLANPAPGVTYTVARVPGADVYERSVSIWLFEPLGPPVDAVITTGENWPDGLAGAFFVGQAQAAGVTANANVLLLTRTDCLPPSVATALTGAGSSRYTILGGTAAVSPAVEVPVVCPA